MTTRSFATGEQELLLRAALLRGPDALRAWSTWRASVDVNGSLDDGSFRLLPLVYANLEPLSVDDPFMKRLKGVCRQTWCKNQQLLYRLGGIVDCFRRAGIRTIVLKGAALAVLAYRTPGVRPMADLDVLVPPSRARDALAVLKDAGWMPATPLEDGDLVYRHAKLLRDALGHELDLHWHVLAESCRLDADSEFWRRAVPLRRHGLDTLALDPTDMFFHVVVHGAQWNQVPPVRWIADAVTLLRTFPDGVDPVRLVAHATGHKVQLRMREALTWLDAAFPGVVPEPMREAVRHLRPGLAERVEFRLLMQDQRAYYASIRGNFVITLLEYQQMRRDTGFFRALPGLPRYLLYRLGLKKLRHLAGYIVAGIVKKSGRIAGTFLDNRHSARIGL